MFSRRRPLPTPASHRHQHRSSSAQRSRTQHDDESQYDQLLKDRIEIRLVDLDAPVSGRHHVQIGARKTSNLGHVASFLKRRFTEGTETIHRADHIKFFQIEKQLHGDDIPKDVSTLWYRVSNPEDDGSFRIRWTNTRQSVYLRQCQLDDLVREIEKGATLRQLRCAIASALEDSLFPHAHGNIEPDQVVIEALGGLRPGPVQGDNWECKNIRSWLCRHLKISLVRPKDYFVFQGFNERYVLHKPHLDVQLTATGYHLKTWFRHEVLTTIRQQANYMGGIKADDISLFYHGRVAKDNTHFRPGKSFDFELSHSAGDAFVQAEAWLLPQSETCSICADDKRVSEFPNRRTITPDCAHEATACKACVGQWITSSMETVAWDRLKCPECPKMLGFKEVEAFATRDVFFRYDKLATKAMLEHVQGFRWCLNPRCDSGQIYPSECTKAKCHACRHYSCLRHDVPWHGGETCEEYDKRTRKQRKNDKLSEKHVKEITKPCPGCKKNVNKYSGCDHITCVCGHEWCWLCFGTYTRDNNSFLQCKHTRECRYRTAPPFWEGGRAFMPFMGPAGRPPRPPGGRPFPIPIRPRGIPATGGNRPAQNRAGAPQLPLPDLPADVIEFIFGGDGNGQGRRQGQPQHGVPFINDAILFDLAQLIHRTL